MCIFSSEVLECKNSFLYRQTNTVPISYTVIFLFNIRVNSKLLFLDKVTMNFIKIKSTTDIFKIIILKNVLIVPQRNPKSLTQFVLKTRGKCRHTPELCFSSHQLEVWTSKSITKPNTRLLTVLWLICQSWLCRKHWIFIPREQIIPQSSGGGSGLGHRKVFLILCPSDTIVFYMK